jgi:hypothetical protein
MTLWRRENLLQHPRIEPVCVVDMADIEILEALAEEGENVGEVLVRWKQSALAESSLRNFVVEESGEIVATALDG